MGAAGPGTARHRAVMPTLARTFDRYDIIDGADLDAAVAKRFNGTVAAQSAAPAADLDSLTSSPCKS